MEQALAHTEGNGSVAIVLRLYLKGLPCDHMGVEYPEKLQSRSLCKSGLGEMNSVTGEKLEAKRIAKTK